MKALADLEARAELVFSKTLERADNIKTIQPERLLSLENAPILGKRVIGKEDVSIAAIITKLGNSDWVRQGLSYYEASDGICPFCQQITHEGLAKSLSEYFDETFEQDNMAIDELLSEYSKESHQIQQQVQAVISARSEFIENDKLDQEIKLLDSKVMVNIQLLNQKKKETSRVIELDSLRDTLDTISAIIAAANKAIDERNAIVSNLATERDILTAQIWKYIVDELKSDIDYYSREKSSLFKAIGSIEEKLKMRGQEISSKKDELRALEKQIVSIQPTLDGINRLLASFGFRNFSLAKGGDNRTYRLVRANGSDAQDTLSEGERNFVTFLYFYYLLKGSQSESGITANKIVVFDDPVSSLDSDVLFIVSSLIRELFDDACQDRGVIKQIFVLTHNVYFHKEITYNSKRGKNGCLTDESFWLIKKSGADSVVERQTTNPIKTAYELLWEEVRSAQRNNMTIQNALRRILENYFRLLGGIPLDDLYHNFEGDEKIICKALCSWVNDGSHSVFDDDYCTMPCDATVARYLDTFRRIFESCGQIAHYNMMMGLTND